MVSEISTSVIVSFPQLLHLIATFSTVCFRSYYLGFHKHLILNIVNVFNDGGNRFLALSILSAVNSTISRKSNQLRLSTMLFGQYYFLSLRSIFFLIDGNVYPCMYFFISSSIKILYPLFNQRMMFNIFHEGNKVLRKKIICLLLFSIIEVLCVCHMYIFLNMQLFDGV